MLKKRGNIWHFAFQYRKKLYRGTTHETNKVKAQAYENEVRRSVRERDTGEVSLAHVLGIWIDERERSDNELQAIRRLISNYGNRKISQADESIRMAIAGSPSTVNRTLSIVNAAFKLARDRGIQCPANIKKLHCRPTKLRFLTVEEWERLEKELSGHVKDICQFAIYTGLRSANVLGLRWSNVSLEKRLVWVDATEAKGKKSISIPLSKEATELLLRLESEKRNEESEKEAYVFTFRNKPVKSIKTSFNKAKKRANLDWLTFHDLRRTWASWKVQNGVPLKVVMELGGWASLDILVKHYAHLSPDHLRMWVDK